MKLYSKLAALGAVVALSAAFASATTYQLGSYSTAGPTFGNQNSAMAFVPGLSTVAPGIVPTTSTTVSVPPGLWNSTLTGSSDWVSYGQTGPTTPRGSQPGGQFAPNGDYVFSTTFTLDSQATGFVFNVLADDTVQVYLDGNTSNTLFLAAPGGNVVCQTQLPNCSTVDTIVNGAVGLALLTAGSHTLDFDVKQIKSFDLGLDWTATINTGTIPEPSTLLLLGTGLVGSAGALLRRMRAA